MKIVQLPLLLLLILFFNSCKKEELSSKVEDPLSKVKDYAKNHISPSDFIKLDWNNATTYQKNGVATLVKIESKELSDDKRTLYIRILQNGFQGNYFASKKIGNEVEIRTTSLDGQRIGVAKISNNMFDGVYKVYENNILIFDNTNSIVISSIPASYAYNYQVYYLVNPFLIGQPGNGSSSDPNYLNNFEYLPSDPSGNGGGTIDIIEIEHHDWDSKPTVDIGKMFKCFDLLVPSGPNCVYTVKLNADLPVNSIPLFPINFAREPGHIFLSVTKTNGSQSVTQVFGFYPIPGFLGLSIGNTPSKVVDDGGHEVNARISMNITEAGFNLMRASAESWATLPYNLLSNNCGDYAVNLFNLARSTNPIVLPLYQPEIVNPLTGTWVPISVDRAPQTLFLTLQAMKNSGHPEAANILIDQTRGTAAAPSHGECP